jgi:hypothetical protein
VLAVSSTVFSDWALELEKAAADFASTIQLQLKSTLLIRSVETELSTEELKRLTAEQKQKYAEITDPTRRKEWSESRRCNWLLETFSFQSRAHSKADAKSEAGHLVVAWGLSDPSDVVQGIGIDVELRTRSISDTMVERFSLPNERKLGLSGLELWTVKEALFKANPANQGSVVTDYQVLTRDSSGIGQGQGPQAEKYLYKTFSLGPWQITLALQTSPNHSRAS